MRIRSIGKRAASLIVVAALSGCAGTEALVRAPAVTLASVEMTDADFDRQTFVLGFTVSNPNPFPLPIRSIEYGIKLGDQRFASGETQANFTVPAAGEGEFMIGVELNLLETTSYVSTLIRTGMRRRMDYELSGSCTVDMPFAKPLEFSNRGRIELGASGF